MTKILIFIFLSLVFGLYFPVSVNARINRKYGNKTIQYKLSMIEGISLYLFLFSFRNLKNNVIFVLSAAVTLLIHLLAGYICYKKCEQIKVTPGETFGSVLCQILNSLAMPICIVVYTGVIIFAGKRNK